MINIVEKFSTFFLSIILFITYSSCGLKSENKNLKSKLDQKEEIIREQIIEIESSKSEIQSLKKEIELMDDKLLSINPEKHLSDLYNEVKSAVYLIYTENHEGISQGSAFVVSGDGLAISNQHVFNKASSAIAINENGDEFLISEILEENEDNDYIIFRLGPLTDSIPFVKISSQRTNIGETAFTVGNPKGLTQTLSVGIVSGYRENFIQTTVEITNGSSGGPLFNRYGEVIGVTSSGMGEANLNFAIDIQSVDFQRHLNVEKSTTKSYNPKERDLIAIMNKYYSSLINEDLDALFNMYSNELSRYHRLFSITRQRAIRDHRDYLSEFNITSIEIIPRSFIMYEGPNGYTIQYNIDYQIKKKSNNEPLKYILTTVAVINRDSKIESIYDNILKKN